MAAPPNNGGMHGVAKPPQAPRPPNSRRPGGALAATAASLASEHEMRAEGSSGRKGEGEVPGPPFKSDKDRRAWLLHEKRQWIVAARLAKRDDATEAAADNGKLPAINVGRGSSLDPLSLSPRHIM